MRLLLRLQSSNSSFLRPRRDDGIDKVNDEHHNSSRSKSNAFFLAFLKIMPFLNIFEVVFFVRCAFSGVLSAAEFKMS